VVKILSQTLVAPQRATGSPQLGPITLRKSGYTFPAPHIGSLYRSKVQVLSPKSDANRRNGASSNICPALSRSVRRPSSTNSGNCITRYLFICTAELHRSQDQVILIWIRQNTNPKMAFGILQDRRMERVPGTGQSVALK
jgi:hypothetical protein